MEVQLLMAAYHIVLVTYQNDKLIGLAAKS